MPKVDFGPIEDLRNCAYAPEGRYICRIVEVKRKRAGSGCEGWIVRFEVIKGQYRGRRINDYLVFDDSGMMRIKLLCSVIGLDVSGEIDLTPQMIEGRVCCVEVHVEVYKDHEGSLAYNNVPFLGFFDVE